MPPTIRRACKTWKEALGQLSWPNGSSRWDTARAGCFHCGKRRGDLKRSLCATCRTDDFVPVGAPPSNPMATGYRLCTDHCTTVMKPKHLFAPGNKKCISCLEKRRARKMKKRNQAAMEPEGPCKRRRAMTLVDDDDDDEEAAVFDSEVPARAVMPRRSAQSARRRIAAIGSTGGAGGDNDDDASYATDSTLSGDESPLSSVVLPITPPVSTPTSRGVDIPANVAFKPSALSTPAEAPLCLFEFPQWSPAMGSKPVPPPRLSAPTTVTSGIVTPFMGGLTPLCADLDLGGLWDDLGSPFARIMG